MSSLPLAGRSLGSMLSAAVLVFLALPSESPGQDLQLGEVDFANSGSPEAQAAFERGLLLLHSFEYWSADDAFREAQRIDPDFAMAYWGEAMTYNHPVWMRQDRDAALEALSRLAPTSAERARLAGPEAGGTEREAAYVRAVDLLFGDGPKEERDRAYADAMAEIHETYPGDVDAAAFYALSLLGTAHEGRDFATYMRAAGVLEQVVDAHPRHPGVAHYLIHSYDDPIHAPLGIRAARAYSEIAPDAPHAQHMTSHIFVALGMWDDVVEANENSLRVLDEQRAAEGQPPAACGHYNFWLEYGYLQQGRNRDALRLLRECYDSVVAAAEDAADPNDTPVGSYAQMLARYVIDANGETAAEPLGWPVDLTGAHRSRLTVSFARGYAVAKQGDAAGLEVAREDLAEAHAALEAAASGDEDSEAADAQAGREEILALELEALSRSLAGDADGAVELARQAAAAEAELPIEFGPPYVDKPAQELLGELLLKAGRAGEARVAFEAALARTPERAAAEEGLTAAKSVRSGGRADR